MTMAIDARNFLRSYAIAESVDGNRPFQTSTTLASPPPINNAQPVSPTLAQEVSYINGLNPNGTIGTVNFWHDVGGNTAYKYGPATAGTGATISYDFQAASSFTATEMETMLNAMAMWESVANVHFVAAVSPGAADLQFRRGADGNAFESGAVSNGSGATIGQHVAQAFISIDTNVPGFTLSGSFETVGGYGLSTIIHEIGHALGLGHGGAYNGVVDPATQQFSAYDERLYTIMSYIYWNKTDAKYIDSYPVTGTNWGTTDDLYYRQAPHTVQMLDILAIQQLYGLPTASPLAGGTVYGFNTNITGSLRDFFDFTVNTHPVVTLYNSGVGNTLDLSGYSVAQTIDLNPGRFSSVGGLTNNLGVAFDTVITTAIGGSGADAITGTAAADTLIGNAGNDRLDGGGGADRLIGGANDDRYIVDNALDRAIEAVAGGYDTVENSASFHLNANVEALVLTGTTAINGYGNVDPNAITGNSAANVLDGKDGNDTLMGNGGADVLNGGRGADMMTGGADNDVYYVDDAGDQVIEIAGGGADKVSASINYTLPDQVETLILTGIARVGTGNALANAVTGTDGNDTLSGLEGMDTLKGGAGIDTIDGGSGNDALFGGAGRDILTGGIGADRFSFLTGDSGPASAQTDRITDFSHADADRVVLNRIDANGATPTDDAFSFIGTTAFHNVAGELRYSFVGADTLIEGDVNGDGVADLAIRLTGHVVIVVSDFVL